MSGDLGVRKGGTVSLSRARPSHTATQSPSGSGDPDTRRHVGPLGKGLIASLQRFNRNTWGRCVTPGCVNLPGSSYWCPTCYEVRLERHTRREAYGFSTVEEHFRRCERCFTQFVHSGKDSRFCSDWCEKENTAPPVSQLLGGFYCSECEMPVHECSCVDDDEGGEEEE